MKIFYTFIISLLILLSINAQTNRSITGIDNNLNHSDWGAAGAAQLTKTSNGFTDGFALPAGQNRMNTREISNAIFVQEFSIPDHVGLSDYNFAWGQFIDHDITLVLDSHDEALNISVPKYDPWMDPNGAGQAIIPLKRSLPIEGTGTAFNNPRQFPNDITAFIDASTVYGSKESVSNWLRTFEGGKLKTSEGNFLPYNTIDGEYDSDIDPDVPFMAMLPGITKYFVAGDLRANENVLLTSLHTIFMREHNNICDVLAVENSNWSDEEIYQRARKMVGAIVQSIVYNEWLPALGVGLDTYSAYNDEVNPQIYNVFSSAAYRYGHTTISSVINRMDNYAQDMGDETMHLKDGFFRPDKIAEMGSIDPFLKGMCMQQEQDFDCKMIDDLRNFLFGPPGAGGMDLAAINLQRGRERGLPDYNTIRTDFGLDAYTNFNDITDDAALVAQLYNVYGDINDIDPWVGMLAERHMDNSLFGELVQKIMHNQFRDLRDGDRFFYLNDPAFEAADLNEITNTTLSNIVKRNSGVYSVPKEIFKAETIDVTVRTIDGVTNNSLTPDWGATGTALRQITDMAFEDGFSAPAGQDRPNPRDISNSIFEQESSKIDPLGLSDYNYVWGQFIDHDITLVLDSHDEQFDIPIPAFDAYFDPTGEGDKVIPLYRSAIMHDSGTDPSNPRRYPNDITAYMDASNIYGSSTEIAEWLRSFEDGKLKISEGNLLPFNTLNGEFDAPIDPSAPFMAVLPGTDKYYVSGDLRANENVLLTSLHTLFMREHNRICDELSIQHPNFGDEQLYQQARKIVGAEIQAVSYNEWIPTMGLELEPYNGYDADVQAQIYNSFSAAIFRYGHSIINSEIARVDNNGVDTEEGTLLLREAFFNPSLIQTTGAIDPYLMGMTTKVEQDLDCKMIDDLRNFLFGPPGSGGMDLAAINIQRGRERGLPDYNSVREQMGLDKVSSFASLSSDLTQNQKLYNVYNDLDKIDLWVGALAEDHLPNSIFGELMSTIVSKQFEDLRDGDRFFFENDRMLSALEKTAIRNTRLSDIIKRNTDLTNIPDLVFIAELSTSVTDIVENHPVEINVFPIPASESINIAFNTEKKVDAEVSIVDIMGRKLYTENIVLDHNTNDISIDISSYSQGIYSVSIFSKEGTVSTKFVKQ